MQYVATLHRQHRMHLHRRRVYLHHRRRFLHSRHRRRRMFRKHWQMQYRGVM